MFHEGYPVFYFLCGSSAEEVSKSSEDSRSESLEDGTLPLLRVFSTEEKEEAVEEMRIIEGDRENLFRDHSNLVAIRSALNEDVNLHRTFIIEFVVLCKHFVPVEDEKELPSEIEGIPTRVRSGFVELLGIEEREHHRPRLPGAGFAAGSKAGLGTIGGFYTASDGSVYGVTCAHCIMTNQAELFPPLTPVYQPSRTYGAPLQYGHVHDRVFGKLAEDGPVVDVCLVKLTENIAVPSRCVQKPNILASPSLMVLQEGSNNFLTPGSDDVIVDGRGAKSEYTNIALIANTMPEISFRSPAFKNLEFTCYQTYGTDLKWINGDSGTWCR